MRFYRLMNSHDKILLRTIPLIAKITPPIFVRKELLSKKCASKKRLTTNPHCRFARARAIGSSTQAICWDRRRPRPQRARRRASFELLIKFSRLALIAGGAPAVPANHLTGIQLTALTIRQVVLAKARECKEFAAKKASISDRHCNILTPGRYSHPYQFTLLNEPAARFVTSALKVTTSEDQPTGLPRAP